VTRWFKALLNGLRRRRQKEAQRQQQLRRQTHLHIETLEDRCVPSAAEHVLLLSVDGLHNADIADPALQSFLTNIQALQQNGATYTDAHTTSPSDSFPGTLSYLTGAGPGTTGVFYDDAYSRTLLAPGSSPGTPPGTEVQLAENLDKNQSLLSGGGNFDASSIDTTQLPIDPTTGQVVFPHQVNQVNTIFDVAHQAGLYTAFSDKHAAYDLVTGPNGNAVNDLYTPEVNSNTALLDPTTHKTVNADALEFGAPVSGLTVSPGYQVTSFVSANPGTATQPDSIAVDGAHVFVGYGNGVAKDGTDGGFSTIVQFDAAGGFVQSFSVKGHNDGLKVDPTTHLLFALQNEDGNPNLAIINPTTGMMMTFTLPSVNHGGGFDDITFLDGKVYLSASNPQLATNTDPAVVQLTFNGMTPVLTPILLGNAMAHDTVHGGQVQLNLQDPDSMTADPAGNLVLTSQADDELITIHHPGTASQKVDVAALSDPANLLPGTGVDDTLFTPSSQGEILVVDRAGAIYRITGPAVKSGLVLSAAQDAGELGQMDIKTGQFTPVVSGLVSPRGLAFLQGGPFADLSPYTLVDASTDPVAVDPTTHMSSDPNLELTTNNVLLTEKYDDLKVHAILNEIQGLPSHTFAGSDKSKVPAIFAMNFQAVSVAQKDFNGGIAQLPNGQEGAPSGLLESALQHTDRSIGTIVAALKSAGLWDETEIYLTAKHGQTPRVGHAGLIKDDSLNNVLEKANIHVAFATGDDGTLIWLANQKQTAAAVTALQDFQNTGSLNVYFKGVLQVLPASQVIDRILSGPEIIAAGLGNPATDSTTPDLVVVLKPGYILVGNPLKFAHKNAEHGGFNEEDTHVALIVSGGALPEDLEGKKITQHVDTKQIAVSVLDALGLDPSKLQGAVIEGTQALPGLGVEDSEQDHDSDKDHDHGHDTFSPGSWSDILHGSLATGHGSNAPSAQNVADQNLVQALMNLEEEFTAMLQDLAQHHGKKK
jgi:arylsulfatase A-like enzyme